MESPAFLHQIAENEILERSILILRRSAAAHVAPVKFFGLRSRRIAEGRGPKISDLELHRNAAALRVFLQRLADEFKIIGKARRQLADIFLLHPAMQHLLLQRDVNALVGIARSLALIIEGPHESIGEKYPGEALRIEVVRHHRPICHRTLDVDLVEDGIEIRCARELLLDFILLVQQPLGMFGRKIVIRISKKRFGCRGQFGIIIAGAQGLTGIRRRGHGVNVWIIRIPGVSVVIECGDLLDLRQKTLIDLLHIRPGKGTRLGHRQIRQCQHKTQNRHTNSHAHRIPLEHMYGTVFNEQPLFPAMRSTLFECARPLRATSPSKMQTRTG